MRTNLSVQGQKKEVRIRWTVYKHHPIPEPPMTLSVAELQPVLHDLFFDTAETLAREAGFCQRARKLTGPVFAQTLVFSLLQNPAATLEDFADTAEQLLDQPVSSQAVDQRFTPAAATFLHELLQEALNHSFASLRPAVLPLLKRFRSVHLRDGTLVTLPAALAALLPGRGGLHAPHGQAAALKVVLEAEVTTGERTGLSLLAGLDNEKTSTVAHQELPAGALLLEDLGFFAGERLQTYMGQGVYVLSRVPAWTAFFDDKGHRLDLVKWLRQAQGWYVERPIRILHERHLQVRLLAVRVPAAEAEQRRQRVRAEAQQRGRPVSQKKLDLCEWNLLVTNAPRSLLRVQEAHVVRRVRWQIELVFKVFKSEGHLDQTRSHRPERVLCELYAKLLALVVQHWLLLAAGYVMLRHSARRASRWVRRRALKWLRGLARVELLGAEVLRLAVVLHRRCRIKSRKGSPSTLDLLDAWDIEPDDEEQMAA